MTPALCGIAIKLLTGAKLVVEIATSPDRSYLNIRPDPTLADQLRKFYSDICLHISMWSCDCVHLLYPEALNAYPLLRGVRRAVFHEFVPVSAVPRHESGGDPYVLLVGAPWYLKGADVLVNAFRMVSRDFPEVRLKIMGHFPVRDQLGALIHSDDRIDILPPGSHPETLEVISRACLLVLPSRCEGMGRVLLEAMAAGIPVVGSKVGGIPVLIRDGENGFLVPPGDVPALEDRMRRLLSDSELRRRMGARGYEIAHSEFNEKVYVDCFTRMIETAVRGKCAGA
jgi:glycosyltransferase involved in cell wall biosynthesis